MKKKKTTYWTCFKHNMSGNTECCLQCVREFIESLPYQEYYRVYTK